MDSASLELFSEIDKLRLQMLLNVQTAEWQPAEEETSP